MTEKVHSSLHTGTFFRHEMESQADLRRKRAQAKQDRWLEVCQQVDARDMGKCRACGRKCSTKALDPLLKAHRHHVEFRSKGGQDIASNLVTLCAICHDRLHVKRALRIEPTSKYGADGPLTIWRTTEAHPQEFISRRETAVHQVEKD